MYEEMECTRWGVVYSKHEHRMMKKKDESVFVTLFPDRNWYDSPDACRLWAPFASNKMIGSSYSTNDGYSISFNRVAVKLSIVLFVISVCCVCVFVMCMFVSKRILYSLRSTWSVTSGVTMPMKNVQWYHCYLCDEQKKALLSGEVNKRAWNKSYPYRLTWIDTYR